MTLEEMVLDVWEDSGEPSDLEPGDYDTGGSMVFDSAALGAQKLIGFINRGYKRILTWKDLDGQAPKFKEFDSVHLFTPRVITGTCAGGTSTTAVLDASVGSDDDRYNRWVLEITGGTGSGQTRTVMDYTGATLTATVSSAWNTTPDATSTYRLTKRWMACRQASDPWVADDLAIDPSTILSMFGLMDKADDTLLDGATIPEILENDSADTGTPSMWWWDGRAIWFDIAPDSERWYSLNYMKMPEDLSTGTDIPIFPEQYHEAIVLWATWKCLKRQRDNSGAYATKQDLKEYMRMVLYPGERNNDKIDGVLEVML